MPELIWLGSLFDDFNTLPSAMMVNGVEDVWLIKRPGHKGPEPPLKSIAIPVDVVHNLELVFAVNQLGEFFCKFKPVRKYNSDSMKYILLADNLLGIEGGACVSPQGYVLAVNDHPYQFSILDEFGRTITSGYDLLESNPGHIFEGTPVPFWKTGADSISAGKTYFTVSGPSLGRLDVYTYGGTLLASLSQVKAGQKEINVGIARTLVDRNGHIWATDGLELVKLTTEGEVLFVANFEEFGCGSFYPSFDTWFGLDSQDNLWCTNGSGQFAGYNLS